MCNSVQTEPVIRMPARRLHFPPLALCCLALVLLLTVTQITFAQEVTATISGVVSDPSGATVLGAKITAKSVERGLNYVATSNDGGLHGEPLGAAVEHF